MRLSEAVCDAGRVAGPISRLDAALARLRTETSGRARTPTTHDDGDDVAAFVGRALVAETPDGHRIRYLRRHDLVAMRRAVGRPKDRRRAAELDAGPPA